MGASVGVLLALAVGLVQESDDRSGWTVTVAEGRGTLLSWLSILFAGFSIVLAVATLTIQNIVSKFSLRMFRLNERGLRDRFVMALFAGTATFVITEQVLLRSTDPAAPVPVFGFVVAMAMMVATGVAMIWYVTTVNRYLRVDRLSRGITARTVRVVEARSSANCGGRLATSADFERSPQASPIRAGANGFFVQPHPSDLMDVAPSSAGRIVVDCLPGAPVMAGQPIGWVAPLGDDGITEHISAAVASAIEVEPSRGIEGAAGYGIVVLVDTAIMALSPAINDPNTAVQVIEEMTFATDWAPSSSAMMTRKPSSSFAPRRSASSSRWVPSRSCSTARTTPWWWWRRWQQWCSHCWGSTSEKLIEPR